MSKPTKKIVAIGGGQINTSSTLLIDQEIIRLTKKKKPTLLFIPTASGDSELYWQYINNHFNKKLGCQTDVLYLVREKLSKKILKEKILTADIIYVGGGNTLQMMRLWRRLGVDILLKQAWQKGIVLCGLSAGSICWFESGHSDSMSFYNEKKWKYINVKGLAFLKGIHCPHFNSSTFGIPRKKYFKNMIQKTGGMGIALDDNCAIVFIDDSYRVISSKSNANAYKVYKSNNQIITKKITKENNLTPISFLYKRD